MAKDYRLSADDAKRFVPSYWPRPEPRISGTAMPTGVHLCDGRVRTSTNLELVLTGAAIMALGAVSAVVAYLVVWIMDGYTPVPTSALLLGVVEQPIPAKYAYWQVALNLILFGCFLVVLRLSPLSGYHAAEHMTVSAIERFGRVDPDQVRQMPRAHPRCGTTLLAGLLPALLIAAPLCALRPELAALIAIVGWTTRAQVGWALQHYLTTKHPTPRQLEAGLRAGRKILEGQGSGPVRPQSPAERLWQRGLLQMVAGVIAAMYVIEWVYERLHLWLDW